ncbi:hypothetical protein ACLMAL_04900 [Nocardia sp. CWNU-33]|uniref:hypothetical protein n=1 Tax=Nocardia sp. CWNU-33 TaxID=3392117 RepID=UPI00398E93CA
MSEIEYVFGTGDGTVHVWSSQADLELSGPGVADALQLDFDGDGLADDALWDSHGTGIADVAALDLDEDGVLDHFYTDPSGLGTWNHLVTGSASDAGSEQLDWIVRTGPAPDHDVGAGTGTAPAESDAPLGYPSAFADRLVPLDQIGALPNQRAATGDHTAEQLNFEGGVGESSEGSGSAP